ncbi:MAG TPA: hypothetical protein ENH00_08255 [Actinobacteria bacterium]|nr:hypothetical protein [Actinomycetota bacterium]
MARVRNSHYDVAVKRCITLPRVGYFRPSRRHRTRFGVVGAISVSVTIPLVAVTMPAVTGACAGGIPLLLILFGVPALKMVVLFGLAAHHADTANRVRPHRQRPCCAPPMARPDGRDRGHASIQLRRHQRFKTAVCGEEARGREGNGCISLAVSVEVALRIARSL